MHQSLPRSSGAGLTPLLDDGEATLAVLETDLDASLHFDDGIVILTLAAARLRGRRRRNWKQWTLTTGLQLRHSDHGGVGTLELHDAERRHEVWRYTLERNAQAIRLAEAFDRQCEIRVGRRESEDEPENVCPDCKALLEPNQEECPVCSREFEAPPTTWTLFRLWRFADPTVACCWPVFC